MLKKLSTIIPIFDYLKITSILRMAAQASIILALSISLSFVYIFTVNFDYFIDILDKESAIEIEQAIKDSLEKNIKINTILEDVLYDVEGSTRAYIFLFHNGIRGVSDIPFLYQSGTHEVVANGISSDITNLQNIPVTVNTNILKNLLENKCYIYYKSEDTTLYDSLLKHRGTNTTVSCPIRDSNKILIGYISVDFRETINNKIIKISETSLRTQTEKLKDIL